MQLCSNYCNLQKSLSPHPLQPSGVVYPLKGVESGADLFLDVLDALGKLVEPDPSASFRRPLPHSSLSNQLSHSISMPLL